MTEAPRADQRHATPLMHECNASRLSLAFMSHVDTARVSSVLVPEYMVNHAQAGREGPMEELIGRLVANVGGDRTAAASAVAIILQFLMKEGPADKVKALIDKMPGAEAAIKSAPPDSS